MGMLLRLSCWAMFVAAASLIACSSNEEGSAGTEEEGAATCTPDAFDDAQNAAPLSVGEGLEGYICPVQDQDWYTVALADGDRIVRVNVDMVTDVTRVDLSYSLWSLDGEGKATAVIASLPTTDAGPRVSGTHCLDVATYALLVRDQNSDAEDARNSYTVSFDTFGEPDAAEPNETRDAATQATLGEDIVAYVACAGDVDTYEAEIPEDTVLRVTLTTEKTAYQPVLQILDAQGELVLEDQAPGATERASTLDLREVTALGGTFYVTVSDLDGDQGDPEVPYTLRIEALDDPDTYEPNDEPSEASDALTPSTVNCNGSWNDLPTVSGSFGAPGDVDWFRLDLNSCAQDEAVLDVELAYDFSSIPVEEVLNYQASVTLVHGDEDGPSACTVDGDCTNLSGRSCSEEFDCEGYSNLCLPDGYCAGADVCLPSGFCGANQIERHSVGSTQGSAGILRMSAPLLQNGTLYLRLSDFRSDAGLPTATYTLSSRVRDDADSYEPNNPFQPVLTNENLSIDEGHERADSTAATLIPVRSPGGCSNTNNWTNYGRISYENDFDFYRYDHPCPGLDCMVTIYFETDAGDTDHGLFVFYNGRSRPWFSRLMPSGSSGALGAGTGYGGLPGGHQTSCFYSFQDHADYQIVVRDLVDSASDPDQMRDWNMDQRYRFCIEKTADGCQSPCENREVPAPGSGVFECTDP